MNVLIAEDDPVAGMIFHRAVEKFGHVGWVARDGQEAWDLFNTHDMDVVISDRMMPRMDGMELCRRIREAGGRGYTYFIFLSAMGEKHHLMDGMEAGADDYLVKPLPDLFHLKSCLVAAQRVTQLHRQMERQQQEMERLNQELFAQARRDPLTGLGNRLQLREDLTAMRARVERYGHSYCAALCDIDSFKQYNDHYGHVPAGDAALATVAQLLKSHCRSGDTAYRYGGEEFLLILPEQTLESAVWAMDRIRLAVEEEGIEHVAQDPPGVLTISIGVARLTPCHPVSVDDFLREADLALYRAKAAGKNRVAAYQPEAELAGV